MKQLFGLLKTYFLQNKMQFDVVNFRKKYFSTSVSRLYNSKTACKIPLFIKSDEFQSILKPKSEIFHQQPQLSLLVPKPYVLGVL